VVVVGRGHGGAREWAADDLRLGRPAVARERLKSRLVEVPWSLPARELLAQAQRADGHPEEAGRWGFLVEGASTSAERAAFERQPLPAPVGTRTRPRRHQHAHSPAVASRPGRR